MGSKFWNAYVAFFVFGFPLIFSYAGQTPWTPVGSTISLAVGIIGWVIFIGWLYRERVLKPKMVVKLFERIQREGKAVTGEVTGKTILDRNQDYEQVIVRIRFNNLAGTPVIFEETLTDSKPHQNRYEKGKTVPLRLSLDREFPAISFEGSHFSTRQMNRMALFVLGVFLYMVVTFAAGYHIFSNGKGWRFITLWYPWVYTPYWGLYAYWLFGRLGGKLNNSSDGDGELLLYGRPAIAEITDVRQTGLFINEQPQVRFILNFEDEKGQTYALTLKRVVQLTELHQWGKGLRNILYLPDNPQEILFVDETDAI